MLFRNDPCGIICIILTYAMLLHCLYVILFVLILSNFNERFARWKSRSIDVRIRLFSFYGTLNALTICTLISLSVISHARAAYFDPGFVPLPKKGLDFSDVQSNESSHALLKVSSFIRLESLVFHENFLPFQQQNEEGWTGKLLKLLEGKENNRVYGH